MERVKWIAMLGLVCLVGCTSNEQSMSWQHKEGNQTVASGQGEMEKEENVAKQDLEAEEETGPKIKTVSEWSKYFNSIEDIEGCVVVFNSNTQSYCVYNDKLASTRTSPCSTFKIMSTLMGLESGVIKDKDTVMSWNKTHYANEAWNKDMSLEEAFKTSCVWYYRQVIDQIDKAYIEKTLKDIGYGNSDISGDSLIDKAENRDLTGFWLESSLKISPFEQVDLIKNIYEGKTAFKKEHIELLKELMVCEDVKEENLSGKTGTGYVDHTCKDAWFVGEFENGSKPYYVVIYLTGGKNTTGGMAKGIASALCRNIDDYERS